jgi:hypothetical protein
MTAPDRERASLGGLPAAWMNLFRAQMQIGSELMESLTGRPWPAPADLPRMLRPRTCECREGRGCCAIPPPCWMPQPLGECTSHVSPCRTACLELVITNCDRVAREMVVEATGPLASQITVAPPRLDLGPMERGRVTACVAVPDKGKPGEKGEAILWVRGAQAHFLRWTVRVGTAGVDSCHEIEVCDCPDYRHHWYDHFYCHRVRPGAEVPGKRQRVPVKEMPVDD